MSYLLLICYINIGLLGGSWHWAKKRYIDRTIHVDLITYLRTDISFTYKAVGAIIAAEYGLFQLNIIQIMDLEHFITAITAGYLADSHLNKCDEVTSSN